MARPPKGPKLVDSLEGDEHTKARLRVVLETITGETPIAEACERLGIKEARFHELRKEALAAMLSALTPKPLGRPRKPEPSAEELRVAELEATVERLSIELKASRLREELAVTFPERQKKEAPGGGRAARRRAAKEEKKEAKKPRRR